MSKELCSCCSIGTIRNNYSRMVFNFNGHTIKSDRVKYKKCDYCGTLIFADKESLLIEESLKRITNKDTNNELNV